MENVIGLFEAHGVLAVFLGVFIEQIGAPVPALPFLLLAGAQAANDGVLAVKALAAASLASVLADAIWFVAGQRFGRAVLALLCRISISPETCVRKSETSFARRGVLTVLFAKFIPGVSTLAPPLAGALGMRLGTFLLLDLAGTVLWAGSGLAAGLVFHKEVALVMRSLDDLGSAALNVLLVAFALYVAWRALRRMLVHRTLARAPRLQPRQLADMIARGDSVLLLDVRGAIVLPHPRIPGSVHAPVGSETFEGLADPAGVFAVVTYCDCPHDASAARAALLIARSGRPAHVLAGGFAAWVAAGLPVEILTDVAAPAARPASAELAGST